MKDRLKQKIGKLLMAGFEGFELNDHLKVLINEYKVSSIILFARNISDEHQLKKLVSDISQEAIKAGYEKPILISIDQENGLVNRLQSISFNMPGAMALASTQNTRYSYEVGALTANKLKDFGINWNLAPVLDMNSNPNNTGIRTRSYGDNIDNVIGMSSEFIKSHIERGVLTSAKHFPGLGRVSVDPHFGLPVVDIEFEDLIDNELSPFKSAIESGVSSVMTAHVILPKIDKENPATMSKTILTEILRNKLNYKGVIISDCLEMGAIVDNFGVSKGAIESLKAGTDMIIISHRLDRQIDAIDSIINSIESGEISEKFIDEKINRIDNMIDTLENNINEVIQNVDLYSIYKDSVTMLKGDGKIGENPIILVPEDESRFIGEQKNNKKIQNAKEVVRNISSNFEVLEYNIKNISQLLSTNEMEKILILVNDIDFDPVCIKGEINIISSRNPYPNKDLFDRSKNWINCYENNKIPLELSIKSLLGKEKVNGKNPILI